MSIKTFFKYVKGRSKTLWVGFRPTGCGRAGVCLVIWCDWGCMCVPEFSFGVAQIHGTEFCGHHCHFIFFVCCQKSVVEIGPCPRTPSHHDFITPLAHNISGVIICPRAHQNSKKIHGPCPEPRLLPISHHGHTVPWGGAASCSNSRFEADHEPVSRRSTDLERRVVLPNCSNAPGLKSEGR